MNRALVVEELIKYLIIIQNSNKIQTKRLMIFLIIILIEFFNFLYLFFVINI
jgi:hypothetical protein